MQKKLIVLAVAAALTAPALAMADSSNVTVYGRAHISLDSNGGNAGNSTTGTKNGLNLTSNSSRIGFKGTEDLGGGLNAVYQFETEVMVQGTAAMFGAQRDTYAGVKGNFGTVVAGRLPLANMYANDANFLGDKVGDAGNMTAGGFGGAGLLAVPSRVSRAIGYVSPSLSGVTVTVGFVPNTPQSLNNAGAGAAGTNNAQKDSSYALRAAYDQDGIFAALNYLNLGVAGINLATGALGAIPAAGIAQSGAKVAVTSLAGGYNFGVGQVKAQYVLTDANQQAAFSVGGGSGVKQSVITIGGQFNVNETSAIKAQFAQASDLTMNGATVVNTGASMFGVDYDYNLSKRTTLYVAYAKVNNKANAQFSATGYAHGGVGAPGATAGVANNPDAFSLGLIHNF